MTPPVMSDVRVAYLVTMYPKLSHTFISREIAGLRGLGAEVHTFTVRRPPPDEIRSQSDRMEAQTTTTLLPPSARDAWGVAIFALRYPSAALAGLRLALVSGAPGLKSRVWQIFYLIEALVLARVMSQRGLRHVHVHLANNAADVARLAVTIGSRVSEHQWSWSLAMHGPTEFADVTRFDLAAKVQSTRFVACISDYCRSQLMVLVAAELWPALHVVRMGIDPSRYRVLERDYARGDQRPLRVLFVGRLVPEKAPQLLIEAAASMPSHSVEVRVIGDGPLLADLRTTATQLADVVAVRVIGPVGQDDLEKHYHWADVFCLPSFAEGLPVVLMEAMATGLPVVTTAIAGIPELVVNGQTGMVVPPGRSDLIASALTIMLDADYRRALGQRASTAVLRDHQALSNSRTLLKLFQQYLNE